MNEQLTKTRTPETVGAEIRNLTAAARYLTVWYAVEIGRRLTEAKAIVPHGGWLDWLKTETEFSQPTASRFMRIFEEYGADQGSLFGAETKYSALNNLSVTNALKLLAVPEEERESFALEVDAEHLSSRELEQAIKERDEARQALEEAREELAETSEELDKKSDDYAALSAAAKEYRDQAEDAERRIKELEARPIEVAVQEPDPAEIERRVAEATEAARKEKETAERLLAEEKEKAKTAADKLREQLKEAEDKLAAADEEDRAGAEQLEAEVAQLKKQLAMSSQEIVMFRIHFTAWQEAYQKMANAMQTMTDEQREKCRAAIRAQVKGWGWCE